MPFSASGIIPDLIFSPHGIPSRMTISHLVELIGGKVGALQGRYINGTTFSSETEEDLRKSLVNLGFRENGTETMYSGSTGQIFKAKIYIGDMYYLKLKHMVANKLHSRARGPIQLLTRQPTEGRAKEGGLRLGEMEKDTFVAHGASLLLKERFDSDKTVVPICESCGLVAVHDEFKNRSYCPLCGDNVEVSKIEILEEVTQLLPSTVWVWNLKYTGKELEISGFADSSSDLIPLFDKSPLFEKVEFLAPVTKERDRKMGVDKEKERFKIKMGLEGGRSGF